MNSDFPWATIAMFAVGILIVSALVVAVGTKPPASFRAQSPVPASAQAP